MTFNIYYKNNEKIVHIYSFIGNEDISTIEDLHKKKKLNDTNGIFLKDQYRQIIKENTSISFIQESIYKDDTIDTIKKKIIRHLPSVYCVEEIYLFSKREIDEPNIDFIYQELTQNETLPLSKNILQSFLSNINHKLKLKQEEYTYDDFISLNLPIIEKKYTIGNELIGPSYNFEYNVDPFDVEQYDSFLEKYSYEMTSSKQQNLLLDYHTNKNNKYNNTIYLTFFDDIINYSKKKKLREDSTINIYFPALAKKNILTKYLFEEAYNELLESTKAMIESEDWGRYQENVHSMNNHYEEIKEKTHGIKHIEFTIINNNENINLPIDILFKIIQTSEDLPIIKYNPINKQERIYRLFCKGKSKNGKNIPQLSKKQVKTISKQLKRYKSLSLMMDTENGRLYIDILLNGNIRVSYTPTKIIDKEIVDEILEPNMNKLIEVITRYLSQTGYHLEPFKSIFHENIDIQMLDYVYNFPLTKNINFKEYSKCIYSVFNVIEDNLKGDAELRFKKVSDYNEMAAIDAYIVELFNQGYGHKDLIKELETEFNLKKETALKKLEAFLKNVDVIEKSNRRVKIRNNPGIKILVKRNKHSKELSFNIKNIQNINYLILFDKYIESLYKIVHDDTMKCDTKISVKTVKEMTKKEPKQNKLVEKTIINGELVVKQVKKKTLFGFDSSDSESDSDSESGSESGSESESESDSDVEPIKAVKKIEDYDIDGMKLNNPNPFARRMDVYEPKLFVKDHQVKGTKFNSYSKTCPWQYSRQPVILSQEEKNLIDQKDKENGDKSYHNSIAYKSEEGGEIFHYICPRYWDLKNNTTISENQLFKKGENRYDAEIKKKKGIIPQDSKVVPPGHTIFEFDKAKNRDKDGNYINNTPGYLEQSKHPKGKCMPCCFKPKNNKKGESEQHKRIKQCNSIPYVADEDADEEVKGKITEERDVFKATAPWDDYYEALKIFHKKYKSIDVPNAFPRGSGDYPRGSGKKLKLGKWFKHQRDNFDTNENEEQKNKLLELGILDIFNEYIVGPHTFPTEQYRVGSLPIAIQKFLDVQDNKCQKLSKMKEGSSCFLRSGIEYDENRSFLGAMANVMYRYKTINKKYKEKKINEYFSIDDFIKYITEHLTIDIFVQLQKGTLIHTFYDKTYQVKEKYEDSFLRKEILHDDNNQFKKICNAYEKFIEYLKDKTSIINYEYLWDLFSMQSKDFFIKGLNIVILEITFNDKTNNVDIICPTNHYSDIFYRDNISTICIIKQGNYYEPIYDTSYRITKGDEKPKNFRKLEYKFFSIKDKPLERILKSIKCSPIYNDIYKFKRAPTFEKLKQIFKTKIQNKLLNKLGEIVGIKIKEGFIPCEPSSLKSSGLNTRIPYSPTFLEDYDEWMDYNSTKKYLTDIAKREKINCMPVFKVKEDSLIVGILTETNHFIEIDPPEENDIDDELERIEGESYGKINKELIQNQPDVERQKTVKGIDLEQNFYNIFRNTVKQIIHRKENKEMKEDIELILKSEDTYKDKFIKIRSILEEIITPHVHFEDYDEKILNEIHEVRVCNKELCDDEKNRYCLSSGDKCQLKIPKTNLIHGGDNINIYYGKIADEFVRYSRISSFILKKKSLMSFQEIEYDLNENEIILLESLVDDYYSDIDDILLNKYVKQTTFYTTNPYDKPKYSNDL